MALFKAALAVVKGGPDKLKDIKDPFGDGPFEYRALDKGFELKSKLLFKGQPVMLTVGKGRRSRVVADFGPSSQPALLTMLRREEPGFPRAMVKRKPDSGHGYIAAANSP